MHLVVGGRDRHQQHVVGAAAFDRRHQIAQQTVLRRPHLAGAAAAAFHVPLQVLALRREPGQVFADHQLVDLVVLEAASDQDAAGAADDGAERPEAEVVAAEDVVALQAVVAQQPRQDEGVGITAMRRQVDQRMAFVERLQLRQRIEIGVDGPGPRVQRAEAVIEHRRERRALHGDDLFEAFQRLGGHFVDRQLQLPRQRVDLFDEARRLRDLPRHLPALDQRRGQHRVEIEQVHRRPPSAQAAMRCSARVVVAVITSATCCGSSYIGTWPQPVTFTASAPRTTVVSAAP